MHYIARDGVAHCQCVCLWNGPGECVRYSCDCMRHIGLCFVENMTRTQNCHFVFGARSGSSADDRKADNFLWSVPSTISVGGWFVPSEQLVEWICHLRFGFNTHTDMVTTVTTVISILHRPTKNAGGNWSRQLWKVVLDNLAKFTSAGFSKIKIKETRFLRSITVIWCRSADWPHPSNATDCFTIQCFLLGCCIFWMLLPFHLSFPRTRAPCTTREMCITF